MWSWTWFSESLFRMYRTKRNVEKFKETYRMGLIKDQQSKAIPQSQWWCGCGIDVVVEIWLVIIIKKFQLKEYFVVGLIIVMIVRMIKNEFFTSDFEKVWFALFTIWDYRKSKMYQVWEMVHWIRKEKTWNVLDVVKQMKQN